MSHRKKTKDDYLDELLSLQTQAMVEGPDAKNIKRTKAVIKKLDAFEEQEMREKLHDLNDEMDDGMWSVEAGKQHKKYIKNLYFDK